VSRHVRHKKLIYTGAIDDYYDYRAGVLPYRSLRFEPEHFTAEQLAERESISGKKGFWQPALQVNYPNEFDYTRIVETKHITGQTGDDTTIVREYPADYVRGGEAYYPIPNAESQRQYQAYADIAARDPNVYFGGRLATYKYYNMDQVVDAALTQFETIKRDWLAAAERRVA
jgi:UDP-galactopyranose mutase